MWFEGGDQLRIEALELVFVLIEQDDALGGEPVPQGIAASDRAAGFGARAGTAERVATIGFDYGMARPSPNEWIR
jgi:hypothetical protein